jgi:Uma2 family endonuclease
MTPAGARRRPTCADLEALPEWLRGEILAGELLVSRRPGPPHVRAASSLGRALGTFDRDGHVEGPGGWWIEGEPELHLDADPSFPVVIPDLAGWRTEALPVLPATSAYTVRPDWVCEILSPSTAADDRALKMPFYARAGVGHLWFLDPALFLLEVYALDAPTWRHIGIWRDDAEVHAPPFDAHPSRLGPLWGGREPPVRRLSPSNRP